MSAASATASTGAVTAMLTLIAFRFAVDRDIPKLPYLTRLDAFILASTFLVLFSLIEVMVTNKLANRKRVELAQTIDRYSRMVFPSVFGILMVVIFFL
jgi:cadmium resistance protein CadD (predicted permease)